MDRNEIKKAILIGIVAGVSGAITILAAVNAYIVVEQWYKDYKQELSQKEWEKSPNYHKGTCAITVDVDSLKQ